MARGIICDVLTGSNEAPLKREALERGLVQDLAVTVDDTTLQSWVTIHAENVTDGREKEILDLLRETGLLKYLKYLGVLTAIYLAAYTLVDCISVRPLGYIAAKFLISWVASTALCLLLALPIQNRS